MKIIRKDRKACGGDEDMVSHEEEEKGKTWIADPTCVG